MIREVRVPKPRSIEDLKYIKDMLDSVAPGTIEYDTYFIIEPEKPKPLPPENIELAGIPFFTISPRKIKFSCPKCKKTIYAMAQLNKQESKVDCEINFCFNCGQEFDWRIEEVCK